MADEEAKDPNVIDVTHDDLISELGQRKHEETKRKSDASESGDKTKKFLERTGLNSQAFSWGGSILKKLDKKDGEAKAMDIIRSLEVMLPMLKNQVQGQSTMDMDLEPAPDEGTVVPINDEPVAAE
jgi:hypothetical protein